VIEQGNKLILPPTFITGGFRAIFAGRPQEMFLNAAQANVLADLEVVEGHRKPWRNYKKFFQLNYY
jgi:hypothetical protein